MGGEPAVSWVSRGQQRGNKRKAKARKAGIGITVQAQPLPWIQYPPPSPAPPAEHLQFPASGEPSGVCGADASKAGPSQLG